MQDIREEIANSISHGLALLIALAALPVLVLSAANNGSLHFTVGAAVFGTSIVVLYLASTLYHSLTHPRAKHFFRQVDHCAIFILIAGSYTPFTLGALRGPWGWSMLAIIWILAVAGIAMKLIAGTRHWWVCMSLYVIMGWLALVAIKPMLTLIPTPGILLIFAGGIAYSGGLVFFGAHRIRYNHFIWHLFVMAGTTCHYLAVLWYGA
ncbi:MAG TPA: hemolysin III family protein [Pyrinomonadaceae bacterium]|nr:hemolysin III family protein [Pyrinomonadaceae bacterium]